MISIKQLLKKFYIKLGGKLSFTVRNFEYNGFYGRELKGNASYTASFKSWTRDPGIAECECSDGKIRLLPTFALVDAYPLLPKQDMSNKVFFGVPSHS